MGYFLGRLRLEFFQSRSERHSVQKLPPRRYYPVANRAFNMGLRYFQIHVDIPSEFQFSRFSVSKLRKFASGYSSLEQYLVGPEGSKRRIYSGT